MRCVYTARSSLERVSPRADDGIVGTLIPYQGFLRTSEFDRARLLDMTARLRGATLVATALCGVAVYPLLSVTGPELLVPLTIGGGGQIAIGFVFPKLRSPERWILGGDCLAVVMICWGVALTSGLGSPLLPLLVLPLLSVGGRHTPRVFAGFLALSIVAPLVAALLASRPALDDDTAHALADLATIGGSAAIIASLMRAEWQFRHQSLLDPLTGLLNRLALQRRIEELRTQAAVAEGPICVLVGDIDYFKLVNDRCGHETGDAVLAEVASILRTNLRSFSMLYRLGGEEFLALLPGLDLHGGVAVAERLREAVEQAGPRGLAVTMSFGVTAATGAEIDLDAMFGVADRRLYEAKRGGRNRVVPGGAGPDQPSSEATASRRKSNIRHRSPATKARRAISPSAPNGSA